MVIDGDNLVITVPGNDGGEARNLGQTARLYVRPVIGQPIPVEAVKEAGRGGGRRDPPGGPPPPGAPAPGGPPPPGAGAHPPPGAQPARPGPGPGPESGPGEPRASAAAIPG